MSSPSDRPSGSSRRSVSLRTEVLVLLLPAALLAVAAMTPRLEIAHATTKARSGDLTGLRVCADSMDSDSKDSVDAAQATGSFAFSLALGARRGDSVWKATLDDELTRRRSEIRQILEGYDVPLVASDQR